MFRQMISFANPEQIGGYYGLSFTIRTACVAFSAKIQSLGKLKIEVGVLEIEVHYTRRHFGFGYSSGPVYGMGVENH